MTVIGIENDGQISAVAFQIHKVILYEFNGCAVIRNTHKKMSGTWKTLVQNDSVVKIKLKTHFVLFWKHLTSHSVCNCTTHFGFCRVATEVAVSVNCAEYICKTCKKKLQYKKHSDYNDCFVFTYYHYVKFGEEQTGICSGTQSYRTGTLLHH